MSNCSRSLESRSKADTTARRPSWSKAHSPIKSRPARSGAVTTSPVWPTNLSEGTCLGPCGFGSDQPGTPPFRFSQLWVWFLRCLEGVHGEVAPERPLLASPQGYLRGQGARARLVGEDPHHPRSALHLLEEPLEHVGRAQLRVVASGEREVGEGVFYAGLEDRDGLRETPPVKLHELLGQSPGRLLTPHLEDGLEVLGHLAHLARRHAREHVALEMHHAPLPLYSRQLACHRCFRGRRRPYCYQNTNTGELRFRALLSESDVDRLELARCLP